MIYKTDLNGFVRSSLMNVSDIAQSQDGMIAMFFVSDPQSSFEIFGYDLISGTLTRSNLNVSSLFLKCDPDDDLVRILPTTHSSYFLTLPKQTAIIECGQTSSEPVNASEHFLNDELKYIEHKITWYNPINTYGIITWICIGSLVLIIILCILKNIINYKQDKKLLDEIAGNNDKPTVRTTMGRTTLFNSIKYESQPSSNFDRTRSNIDKRPLQTTDLSE